MANEQGKLPMPPSEYKEDIRRVEAKIDKLADAIVNMVRMEERMVTLFKRMDNYDSALREFSIRVESQAKDLSDRIYEMEKVTVGRGQFFRWADRAGTAIIGAAVGLAFAYLK